MGEDEPMAAEVEDLPEETLPPEMVVSVEEPTQQDDGGSADAADGADDDEQVGTPTVEFVGVRTAVDREAEARAAAVTVDDAEPPQVGTPTEPPEVGTPTEPQGATPLPEVAQAVECVKVAVRVRPLSAKEVAEGSSQCVRFPGKGQIVIVSAAVARCGLASDSPVTLTQPANTSCMLASTGQGPHVYVRLGLRPGGRAEQRVWCVRTVPPFVAASLP
jgi:hypothetical protein